MITNTTHKNTETATTYNATNKQQTAQREKVGFPSGIIRQTWNDTENVSMAPAQG